MIRKALAGFLILLTIAPFTAPFPTCDLGSFLEEHPSALAHGPASAAASLGDGSLSHALPTFRAQGRSRFIALSETRAHADGPRPLLGGVARSAGLKTPSSKRDSSRVLRI